MEPSNHVDYEVDNGVAEVVLNRPDKLNAFDADTLGELNVTIQEALEDPSVYVIVISGHGRAFCAGADVTAMGDRSDRERKHGYGSHLWLVQNVTRLLYFGDKPTIAAVNGPAVGAGCDFALSCDLRVMDEEAFLCEQFVNVGLVPGDGGGWLLPRLVGESKAKELILTGRNVYAEEAESLGLVAEVTDSGGSMEAARDLARTLRDKPARALQSSKFLVNAHASYEEYARAAFEAQWTCINDPEHAEAVNAVIEGREPSFDREY